MGQKVKVYLYGSFGLSHPGYDPVMGHEVEVPRGARVKDLLACLGISTSQGPIVTQHHRILNRDDEIDPDEPVRILQIAAGG